MEIEIQEAEQFLSNIFKKTISFNLNELKFSIKICKLLKRIYPEIEFSISKNNSDENFKNFFEECKKQEIIEKETNPTTDKQIISKILLKIKEITTSPNSPKKKIKIKGPKSPKKEITSKELTAIIQERLETTKTNKKKSIKQKMNEEKIFSTIESTNVTEWVLQDPELYTKSSFDSKAPMQISPFSLLQDLEHIPQEVIASLKQKFASNESSFDALLISETGTTSTSSIAITSQNICIYIQGSLHFRYKFNASRLIKVFLSPSKQNQLKIIFPNQEFVFQTRNQLEVFLIWKVILMFQTYYGNLPETHPISGDVIGLDHEVEAIALRCEAKNEAVFPVQIYISKANKESINLKLSATHFTLFSVNSPTLSLAWESSVFHCVEFKNNSLQIQIASAIQNFDFAKEKENLDKIKKQSNANIVIDCNNIGKRKLISKCISLFSESKSFPKEKQPDLPSKQFSIKMEQEQKNNQNLLPFLAEQNLRKNCFAEFNLVDGAPTIIQSNTILEPFDSPLFFYERESELFEKHQTNTLSESRFQIETCGIRQENVELVLDVKHIQFLYHKNKKLLISPYFKETRILLHSKEPLYFVLILSPIKRFLLKTKTTTERSKIYRDFTRFFNMQEDNKQNPTKIYHTLSHISTRKYSDEITKLSQSLSSLSYLRTALFNYFPDEKIKKSQIDQDLQNSSQFNIFVANSFNQIVGIGNITLYTSHFDCYSLPLFQNDPDSLFCKFFLDEDSFVNIVFPSAQTRNIFINDFSMKRRPFVDNNVLKGFAHRCTFISSKGSEEGFINLESDHYTVKTNLDSFSLIYAHSNAIEKIDKKSGKFYFSPTTYFIVEFETEAKFEIFLDDFEIKREAFISKSAGFGYETFRTFIYEKGGKLMSAKVILSRNHIAIVTDPFVAFIHMRLNLQFLVYGVKMLKIEIPEIASLILEFSQPRRRAKFIQSCRSLQNKLFDKMFLNQNLPQVFHAFFLHEKGKPSTTKIEIHSEDIIFFTQKTIIRKYIPNIKLFFDDSFPRVYRIDFTDSQKNIFFTLADNTQHEHFTSILKHHQNELHKKRKQQIEHLTIARKNLLETDFYVSLLNNDSQLIQEGILSFSDKVIEFRNIQQNIYISLDQIANITEKSNDPKSLKIDTISFSYIFSFSSPILAKSFLKTYIFVRPQNSWIVALLDENSNFLRNAKIEISKSQIILTDNDSEISFDANDSQISSRNDQPLSVKITNQDNSYIFKLYSQPNFEQFFSQLSNIYFLKKFNIQLVDEENNQNKNAFLKFQKEQIQIEISEKEKIAFSRKQTELITNPEIGNKVKLINNNETYVILFSSLKIAEQFQKSFNRLN
ncbi:hypothetical protein M0811_03089 [Anaeramoeba ignava]|uniref:Uncharacterized protein n=1 Tax=Anaeramoeba ignava TaxID=1746090 RepID=A0A9Q0L6K2_ANAIG|nr:hypothetical protein M0811_03089 [Anaeramoeba ignava]